MPTLPFLYFGDSNHHNLQGAQVYFGQIATLLKQSGVEK
jgi:hypothetical protein